MIPARAIDWSLTVTAALEHDRIGLPAAADPSHRDRDGNVEPALRNRLYHCGSTSSGSTAAHVVQRSVSRPHHRDWPTVTVARWFLRRPGHRDAGPG